MIKQHHTDLKQMGQQKELSEDSNKDQHQFWCHPVSQTVGGAVLFTSSSSFWQRDVGYALHTGGGWSGGLLISDQNDIETIASELLEVCSPRADGSLQEGHVVPRPRRQLQKMI